MAISEIREQRPAIGRLPILVGIATLGISAAAGGVCVWWNATSDVWLYGGVPVHVTRVGHVIFLCLGTLLGLPGGMASLFIGTIMRVPHRGILLPTIALPLGCATAFVNFHIVVFRFFFTLPQELFDLLTD